MIKLIPALMTALLVTGCTLHPQPPRADAPPPPPSQPMAMQPPERSFDASQAQCRNELEAMQAYNVSVYQQYRQRFDRATGQLNKYLEIREKVGAGIDDIAMPKYQYGLRKVCFEIRSELTRLIVKEV